MVSIVIATFNSEDNLQRAIDSVINQTSSDVELLIVDGKSTDNTLEIIHNNNDKIKWWTTEQDDGIYDAWNKAILKSSGEWIIFLGSDDQLYDDRVIEDFYKEINNYASNDFDIIYGMVAHVNRNEQIWLMAGEQWSSFSKKFVSKAQMLPHQGVFHSKKIFDRGIKFNSNFKIAGDYELLLRILKDKNPFFLKNFIVAKMQIGGVSSIFNNIEMHKEFMLARKINGYQETVWTTLLRIRYRLRSLLVISCGLSFAKKVNNIFRVIQLKPYLPE